LQEPEDSFSSHDNVTALRTISVAVARLENILQVRMTAFGDPDRREQQVESMLALMEQSEIEVAKDIEGEPSIVLVGAQHIVPALGDAAPDPPPPPSKNKGGGQVGNSNAYKHGFYSRAVTPSEKTLLQGNGAGQLRHEETLLRILTRRTWRSMRAVRSTLPWQEKLFTVRTIGYTVFVIAKLQRARRRFYGDKTDLEKDIELGLSEACADLGILDYFHAQVEK
jgi:hypothetical protein